MEKNCSFFVQQGRPFPEVSNSKTPTGEFLRASESITVLIAKLGKTFAPARYDLSCNIEKISKIYTQDPSKNEYLEDMVLSEKNEGIDPAATEALMWLRRGLHFMRIFFDHIVSDTEHSQDLSHFLELAYQSTLKRYHGWVVRNLFRVISQFVPSRQTVLGIIALDREEFDEACVLEDMRKFTEGMGACIDHLIKFYADNGLEHDGVV